jgi:hypothetical protein
MRLKKLGKYRRQCWQAAVSGLAIVLLSLVSFKLHFNAATVVLLYLLVIVWQSLAGGFILSAAVANNGGGLSGLFLFAAAAFAAHC